MTTTELRPAAALRGSPAPLLSLERVYLVAAVGVTIAAALAVTVRPNDFWWHLAYGRDILATGSIPAADTFTHTQAGQPFVNQMWLAQVAMYLLYRGGGLPLVLVAHAASIALAYGLLLRFCIQVTGRPRLAALVVLALALPVSFSNWAVRPQAYAFALFVGFVVVLLRSKDASDDAIRPFPVYVLPLLMLVWVNTHGSFVIGLAAVSLVAVVEVAQVRCRPDEVSRRGAVLLTATAAATWGAAMVNPQGPSVLAYVARLMTNPSVAQVSEWQPVKPSTVHGAIFFLAVAVVMIALVHGRRRPAWRETVLVVAFVLLGSMAMRNTVWFGIVAAPILCRQLAASWPTPHIAAGSRVVNAAFVIAITVGVVAFLPWVRLATAPEGATPLVRDTPEAAATFLAQMNDPPQRLFNELGYGSYLPWAVPDQATFIDPRFELFPPEQLADYRALSDGKNVGELAADYGVDGFLINVRTQSGLVQALSGSTQWEAVYQDGDAVLFLPRATASDVHAGRQAGG